MHINFSTGNDEHPHQTLIFDRLLSPAQALSYQCAIISNGALSSWPYEIIYFWLLGQVLCEAQRREHSRSYVTGVVSKQSA